MCRAFPPQEFNSYVSVLIGNQTYQPTDSSDYQFVRLTPQAQGVRLVSRAGIRASEDKHPDYGLVNLEPMSVPGGPTVLSSDLTVKGMQLQGRDLVIEMGIQPQAQAAAVRVVVARGQLPEDWWLSWNRGDAMSPTSKEQTDGLLLLFTSLGKLMVTPGSTPAAAFCLAFGHT